MKLEWISVSRNPQITRRDVFNNPHLPWSIQGLVENPNMTYELVQKFIKIVWDWYGISQNASVYWEDIQKHPQYPWDAKGISRNPNITMDIIQENPFIVLSSGPSHSLLIGPWDWKGISRNPNITFGFVLEHLSEDWDWFELSRNPAISWEIIKTHLHEFPWDMKGVSQNPNVRWNIIKATLEEDPAFPWDWEGISRNPSITWKIVKKNPQYPWNWKGISGNPNIDHVIIKTNTHFEVKNADQSVTEIEIPWDWAELSRNTKISMKFICENEHKPWDWVLMSRCYPLEWEDIQSPQFPFSVRGCSYNPGFHLSFIDEYSSMADVYCLALQDPNTVDFSKLSKLGYIHLSANKAITPEIVSANSPERWSWQDLIRNPNFKWEYVKTHFPFTGVANDQPAEDYNLDLIRYTRLDVLRIMDISQDIEFLDDLDDLNDEEVYVLSLNEHITWEHVRRLLRRNLEWVNISRNPNITWDIIISNQISDDGMPIPWDWVAISTNPNITWDIIQRNLYLKDGSKTPWDWHIISMHPNITPQIIHSNLLEDISKRMPWNWVGVMMNPNTTWEFIVEHLSSGDIQLSLDEFKSPDWDCIAANANITWDIIKSNTIKVVIDGIPRFTPWHWRYISQNRNITPNIVMNSLVNDASTSYPPWDWNQLSSNPMDSPYYTQERYRRGLAKRTTDAIYKELMIVTWNPERHPAFNRGGDDLLNHPFVKLPQQLLYEL